LAKVDPDRMRDKKTAKAVGSSKPEVRNPKQKVEFVSEFSNLQIAELSNLLPSSRLKP